MAAEHPIFIDILRGDLEAVKQRVLADPAVLEEKGSYQMTPLIYAITHKKPTIAHWLIDHRGQHDVNTQSGARRMRCTGRVSAIRSRLCKRW